MLDRNWKLTIAIGLTLGAIAILLSVLGGSHFDFHSGQNGSGIDIRIGPSKGFPTSLLGTAAIILLLLGTAFWAVSKQTQALAESAAAQVRDPAISFLHFLRTLRRSRSDRWLGGVCGGLGASSPVPAWTWRAIFLILAFCLGTGVMAYVILWVCIPEGLPALPPAP